VALGSRAGIKAGPGVAITALGGLIGGVSGYFGNVWIAAHWEAVKDMLNDQKLPANQRKTIEAAWDAALKETATRLNSETRPESGALPKKVEQYRKGAPSAEVKIPEAVKNHQQTDGNESAAPSVIKAGQTETAALRIAALRARDGMASDQNISI